MKSSEIIQPTPITQPVATSGTRNTIPEAATGTNNASVVEGFPDMTMISPTNGGLPPFGQDFNGLFYLSTDQKVFLQNGGYITFNQNVSDTIGGYPQGAILDYITESGTYGKVQSLIDDNTYNFVENVDYINGEYWKYLDYTGGFANVELSNLASTGLSQYNAFSVNTGDVSDSGNPSFLTLTETSETTTNDETDEETRITTYTLSTSGDFDVTTADGTIYNINETLTYSANNIEDGTYNIFIDPIEKTIELIQNKVTAGSSFPSSASSGDFLLNVSKIPYDLQEITIVTETDEESGEETTTTTITKGLNLVLTGSLTISGGGGSLTLNEYNSNGLTSNSSTSSTNAIGEPVITLLNDLNNNEIWLEGAEVSKTTYAALYEIYGDTYGTPESTDNFILPDFRDRVIQGGNDFGYIEAGLPNHRHSSTLSARSGYTNTGGAWTAVYAAGTTYTTYASSDNSIYGNSDTVQPPAIKVRVKTRYA